MCGHMCWICVLFFYHVLLFSPHHHHRHHRCFCPPTCVHILVQNVYCTFAERTTCDMTSCWLFWFSAKVSFYPFKKLLIVPFPFVASQNVCIGNHCIELFTFLFVCFFIFFFGSKQTYWTQLSYAILIGFLTCGWIELSMNRIFLFSAKLKIIC